MFKNIFKKAASKLFLWPNSKNKDARNILALIINSQANLRLEKSKGFNEEDQKDEDKYYLDNVVVLYTIVEKLNNNKEIIDAVINDIENDELQNVCIESHNKLIETYETIFNSKSKIQIKRENNNNPITIKDLFFEDQPVQDIILSDSKEFEKYYGPLKYIVQEIIGTVDYVLIELEKLKKHI